MNAQGSMKEKQEYPHLQDSHCAPACDPLDKISICLSWGMALPKCGYNTSAFGGNSLFRGLARRGMVSSGICTSALF
jgi:hypothetical protein